MADFTASDRYVKLDAPATMPGCCFFCRKHDTEFVIDLKMNQEHPVGIEMDGAVYQCSECIDFIARLSGYTKSEHATKLQIAHNELVREHHKALAQIKLLEKIQSELVAAGYPIPDDLGSHLSYFRDAAESDELKLSESTEDTDRSTEPGDPELPAAVGKEGSDGARASEPSDDSQLDGILKPKSTPELELSI